MTTATPTNRRQRRKKENDDPQAPNMSIPDTAAYLEINTHTVRAMIADGRLTAYRLGPRIIRLRRAEIDAALQRMG